MAWSKKITFGFFRFPILLISHFDSLTHSLFFPYSPSLLRYSTHSLPYPLTRVKFQALGNMIHHKWLSVLFSFSITLARLVSFQPLCAIFAGQLLYHPWLIFLSCPCHFAVHT